MYRVRPLVKWITRRSPKGFFITPCFTCILHLHEWKPWIWLNSFIHSFFLSLLPKVIGWLIEQKNKIEPGFGGLWLELVGSLMFRRASSMMQAIKYTMKNVRGFFIADSGGSQSRMWEGALQLVHNLLIILHKRNYLNLGSLMKPVYNGTINWEWKF
jgi:hypothetical protein